MEVKRRSLRVAFVYDRVNKWGGAERVLLALHEIWPEAPLFTAVYNPKTATWAKTFKVIPSFADKFPFAKTYHELYPWLMPLAFESFDFSEYDLVISVTSEAAKGIITKPSTLHICYCLTPTRYLWSGYNLYFDNKASRLISGPLLAYLKRWDILAAHRPDIYLAISQNVKRRIKYYYGRDAKVIYPPVETDFWQANHRNEGDYFLIVSRLVPYKRVDLAVRAFNKLGLPLKIIGDGNQILNLKRMAKGNIDFLGPIADREVLRSYQNCQAVVCPQEEDLGLVPLEAQACGKPVIAYGRGGAVETVIEGKTGVFFYPQTVDALASVLTNFDSEKFSAMACRENSLSFSKKRFKIRFRVMVEESFEAWQKNF